MAFYSVYCKAVFGLWTLWDKNALELANHSMHNISYRDKPYNKHLEYTITKIPNKHDTLLTQV